MQCEKLGQERLSSASACIILHRDHLGVAGILFADIVVARVDGMPTRKSYLGSDYAVQLAQVILPAPETAAAEQQGGPSGLFGVELAVLGLVLLAGNELDRQAIHAVTGVLFREALTVEHVAQVAATVIA